MGSRGRSIRLRIYFLVAIPLIAMIGMLTYLVATTVNDAVGLDRAPGLITGTAIPAAKFVKLLQAERLAAVIYLAQPNAANGQTYDASIAATDRGEQDFRRAMSSSVTVGSEGGTEAQAISAITRDLSQLGLLRGAVQHRALTPLATFTAYSNGIADGPKLFLAEANSVNTDVPAADQSLGIIATAQAREGLSQEDALLAGALAAHKMSLAARGAFNQAAAERQAYLADGESILNQVNLAAFTAQLDLSPSDQQRLTAIEQAVAQNTPIAKLGLTPAAWQALTSTLLNEYFDGGVNAANALLVVDHQTTHTAWVKVAVVSGAGLLGLLVTILVTTLAGRGIIRRLRGLERSALALAENQLPDVIGRLRRGENVDPAAEAPPLRVGRDEIGRVGQAFHLVRQTAIAAAVDEARLRRGLNDVFRSLARRSQSLLHRQLALLDQMERRATDPEALDDLFQLDHLTTRMRRHAEGLVILAGGPPGRAWSTPVRMVDVMRGAIAEVEDYARVAVATKSQAALAGSAVADVIHLLAELIENATMLSPPYTSVRVSGDTVASGFSIEVEDRGLGISPQRLAELNARLATPPEFNPSDSEQLGLFVVSQLAKRHGIRVTLQASPDGGTAAAVLIPEHLVVTEEAFRAGLPGAIVMAPPANGHPQAPGTRGSGPAAFDVFTPLRRPAGAAETPVPAGEAPGPAGETRFPAHEMPLPTHKTPPPAGEAPGPAYQGYAGVAPFPGTGGVPFPNEPSPFPAWTGQTAAAGSRGPVGPPGPGSGPPSPGSGPSPAGPPTPMVPVAGPRTANLPGPPWELSRQTGPLPVLPAERDPASPGPDQGGSLPRRVRQANLAPQLRADPPRRLTATAPVGPTGGPTGGPTPAEIRQTMSALRHGRDDGRSPQAAGQGVAPGSGADPEPGSGGSEAGPEPSSPAGA
jgi:signal transduction histidine kinase